MAKKKGVRVDMNMFRSDMPVGRKRGKWRVSRITLTKRDVFVGNMQCPERACPPGKYTGLYRGGQIVVSDTPAELRDLAPLLMADVEGGHVLMNGLGLGLAVGVVFARGAKKVTVVEIEKDVIELCGPHLKMKWGDGLEFVHADAIAWQPPEGVTYDAVWHDIWDNITDENWPVMKLLHRKYARRSRWQDSWARSRVREMTQESTRFERMLAARRRASAY